MLCASAGPRAGFFSGLAATVLLAACSLPETSPLERLYGRLDSGGLIYFHADFNRLAASPALQGLLETIGGGALKTLQAELVAGAVLPAKTQLLIRTRSAYTGTLAALGSASVERIDDRLLLVNLDNRRPLAPPRESLPLPAPDESAAVQIRFRPPDLYAPAELVPQGFNLNFIAKALENARTASLTVPAECLRCMRLTLAADDAERAAALRETIAKSLQFVGAVTRAADPSSVWLPAIESVSIELDNTAVRISLPLADGILSDLQDRLSRPGTDR